jgi:hypothetical protein
MGTRLGNLIGSIKAPGGTPYGLTFASDKGRLWNVDDGTDHIYEIGTLTNYSHIKSQGVGSHQLANSSVYSSKIANDAIGSSAMIGAGAILGYNIENNAIGSQQLDSPGRGAYPGLEEYKFAEHYEHGTITDVTATGRYKSFSDAFYNMHVVITGVGGIVYLALAPAPGSFKVQRSTAGTSNAHYHAWGGRL